MRHQQFIAHTITQGLFPTVGPQLAGGPVPAFKLLGRSQQKVQTTADWPYMEPLQSHVYAKACVCTRLYIHTLGPSDEKM